MSKLLTYIISPCRTLLPFAFLLLTLVAAAHAQSSTATLSGTVEDEKGGVVPGAKVNIVNTATGARRDTTTNQSGSFTFVALQPNTYTLTVEQTGFATVQTNDVVLNVGDQKSLLIQLKVSQVAGEVIVTDDPSTVRTDGSVGTVIDRQFVQNIPLNGRSFQSLLELTPGVVIVPAGATGQEGGQFSVNGQRTNANVFTVDGVSANTGISSNAGQAVGQSGSGQLPGLTASGTTAGLVSVDALQEFRIQTSSYAPEFGRQPGGQISLVTRSGENDFHGTVFDYVRNEALDANNWFNNRNRLPKPPTRQHMFGGTFSGPIYFPNFGDGGNSIYNGKNRTFFFFSYEGLRLVLPQSAELQVPTLCFRGEATCPTGQSAALPQYQPFLRAFPKPNGPEVGGGLARFAASYGDPSTYDATAIRLDHSFGKLTFFGRFSHTPSTSSTRMTNGLSYTRNSTQNNTSFTAGSTWAVSNAIVNDIRFNYTTNDGPFYFQHDNFGGAVPLQAFGFLGRSPESAVFTVFPNLPGQLGISWGRDTGYEQRQFNIVDNLLVKAGDHNLKLGVDFRRSNPLLQDGTGGGLEQIGFTTNNMVSGNAQSGKIFSWFVLGLDGQPHAASFDNLSVYAQDTWQVNPRLTLTYGLRWEFVPPARTTEGPPAPAFDGLDNPLLANNVSVAPTGSPMWNTTYLNFAPRLGASYLLVREPGRQLVVRGGAGIFYDLGFGGIANAFIGFGWPFASILQYPATGHPDPACAGSISFPLPACALVPPVPGTSGVNNQLFVMDPDVVLPRTYQWNVSAEQSLGANQTITVSYVGALGRDLLKRDTYTGIRVQGITYLGTSTSILQIQRNGGHSDYQALQLQFQRRLTRGFQGLISYTLGRSRDTDSTDIGIPVPGEIISADQYYGYSSFDVRHNLTAAATYQIPSFKGNSFLGTITRDWGIDLMFRARTAFPLAITVNTPFPGLPGNTTILPNLISGVPIYVDDTTAPGGRRLNTAVPTLEQLTAAGCRSITSSTPAKGAFCTPLLGVQGNLPRGLVRGFGAKQIDLSLRREFGLWESVRMQLRFEAFNLFNWPNFSNPSGSLASGNFGSSTQTLSGGLGGLNALYQIGGPRSMQGAIRISF